MRYGNRGGEGTHNAEGLRASSARAAPPATVVAEVGYALGEDNCALKVVVFIRLWKVVDEEAVGLEDDFLAMKGTWTRGAVGIGPCGRCKNVKEKRTKGEVVGVQAWRDRRLGLIRAVCTLSASWARAGRYTAAVSVLEIEIKRS